MKRFCASCALPTLLLPMLLLQMSGAAAQATDEEDLAVIYGDKASISIATGSRQPLRRAPAVASVITAEDIVAIGATDLDQVLETVPGMHVTRSAASAYSPMYLLRGIGVAGTLNPQILMLQNGIPMTTMYSGDKGTSWAGLPVENIARIEIIRGPGSALYGADAYAGVINIITKSAADIPGTEGGMRAGSFNTRSAWVQHGGTLGPIAVAAYLQIGSTDGIKKIISADAQTRIDKLVGTHASLAPGPLNTGYDAVDASLDLSLEKWRLRGGYKLRDNVGTAAGIASALDPTSTSKNERLTADLSWTDPQFARDWGLGLGASYLQFVEKNARLVLFPAGATFPTGSFPEGVLGGPSRWDRQIRLSAYATYGGLAGHNMRAGVGHDDLNLYRVQTFKNYFLNAAGTPVPTGPVIDYAAIQPHIRPQRRQVDYLYLQDEWNFAPDWALTAGVRHDHYSDFGGTTNPRLALVWDAAQNLTAKLLYGQAFRAPSFNEQYGINPVINGNPNLRPETIKTTEAALSWQASHDTQVNLTAFRYDMQDIIRGVQNPAPAPGATVQNSGSQHGQGVELELAWDLRRNLRLSGNYSWQRSIDETTHQDAGYAPHHHLYARADWRFAGGWMLSPQVNWVADRKRAAGDARAPVADYKTVDLTLRTTRGKDRWDFALSVQNLFNADVREPSLAPGLTLPNDLPMAPRAIFLQAIYKL